MKLQLDQQRLRVRIDESELARLLGGQTIASHTCFAGAFEIRVELQLVNAITATLSGQAAHWCIGIPEAVTRELAVRLPTREGLRFELGTTDAGLLELLFDVDVRDSARRRRLST